MLLSKRCRSITDSATMKAASEAKKMQRDGIDIIKLDVGEPDFDTPLHIKASGIEAIQEGSTKYTPAKGEPKTLAAIRQKLERENQLTYESSEVTVAPGAKQAIYNALLAIVNPDDEVIIITPYWPSYKDMIKLVGGKVKKIHTDIDNHFKISPSELEKSINEHTKMLIFNSPCNPSGAVYSKEELKALAKVLLRHPHVCILSDDVYERIHLNESEPAPHLLTSEPRLKKRTIVINSLSKTYAMTGWRLGYAAGPENIIKAMAKLQSQIGGASSSIAQRAAIDALSKQSHSSLQEMIKKFEQRHEVMCERLERIHHFSFLPAKGAFYLFVKVQAAMDALNIKTDVAFTEQLLKTAHVSCVAGSAFGLPGYVRFSFATRKSHINTAFDRIEKFLEQEKSHDVDENSL